ncbi:hypothetical protein C8J56DRAFT_1072915 [Mycena floridula]|nr:hypothetical protein C8J56DRAFT_1072915 [Mycena floridula]
MSTGHLKIPSFGKPLNVLAQEFKPLIRSLDLHPFPILLVLFPIPAPLALYQCGRHQLLDYEDGERDAEPAFRVQGREKRQRKMSDEGEQLRYPPEEQENKREEEPIQEGDSFASSKFPPTPQKGLPTSTPKKPLGSAKKLNPTAPPFSLLGGPGFDSSTRGPGFDASTRGPGFDSYIDANTAHAENGDSKREELEDEEQERRGCEQDKDGAGGHLSYPVGFQTNEGRRDYASVKMQLDKKEAEERLVRDRETKLLEQVTALESKVVHLQNEFSNARDQIWASRTPVTASKVGPAPTSKIGTGERFICT